jgi:hypothetical protein
MRSFILTAAICLMAWSTPAFRVWTTALLEHADDPHVVAAIELRCASQETGVFRDNCAKDLRRDFDQGVREPETIVRLHCTQFSSDWALSERAPDSICRELYGGWIEG